MDELFNLFDDVDVDFLLGEEPDPIQDYSLTDVYDSDYWDEVLD